MNTIKNSRKSRPPSSGSREHRQEIRKRFKRLLDEIQSGRVHFRNVVERNMDGTIVVGEDGVVRYVNPAAELLFGKEREEIVGHAFGLPLDADTPIEVDFVNTEGKPGIGEMRVIATEWEGQKATLISFRDITRRKQTENKIRELNEQLEACVAKRTAQLEAVNRELEAFNYAVSHDLRAPMARIDGYASLLLEELEGTIDGEHVGYLGRIRAAVGSMVKLTDGLLELSQLTNRKLVIQEIDLSAAALQTLEEFQKRDPERKVTCRIAPELKVTGDLVLLRVVLENLLSNAWKYTGKQPNAEIEFGLVEKESEWVFFVRDNGSGFDMAHAGKLFRAFQRLHNASEFPGIGVGLTTVQRIIYRHGGRVWAEAEVDKGATFFFTLPDPKRESSPPLLIGV